MATLRAAATRAGAIVCLIIAAAGMAIAGATPAVKEAPEVARVESSAVEVWIRGGGDAVASVREVVDELLRRAGLAVAWHTEGQFRPETMLDQTSLLLATPLFAGRRVVARIWIDLGVSGAADLYLGDGAGQRFVIRRRLLPHGLDEVAREEIGRIVGTAALALTQTKATSPKRPAPVGREAGVAVTNSDAGAMLSRAEARAALDQLAAESRRGSPRGADDHAGASQPGDQRSRHHNEARDTGKREDGEGGGRRALGEARAPAASAGTAVLAVGTVVGAELYARDPAVVGRIGVTVAGAGLGRGKWLTIWSELDTTLPASHPGVPIHLGLRTDSWRAGLGREWGAHAPDGGPDGGRWAWRLIVGAGLDHVTFTPSGDPNAAAPAPDGTFWTAVVRGGAEAEFRPWGGLRVMVALTCDVVLADVHYDVRNEAGLVRRDFVPFAVRPALSAGLAWRF